MLPGLLLAALVCVASLGVGIWAAMDDAVLQVANRVFGGMVALAMLIRLVQAVLDARDAAIGHHWRRLAWLVAAVVVLAGLCLLALSFALPVAAPPAGG